MLLSLVNRYAFLASLAFLPAVGHRSAYRASFAHLRQR